MVVHSGVTVKKKLWGLDSSRKWCQSPPNAITRDCDFSFGNIGASWDKKSHPFADSPHRISEYPNKPWQNYWLDPQVHWTYCNSYLHGWFWCSFYWFCLGWLLNCSTWTSLPTAAHNFSIPYQAPTCGVRLMAAIVHPIADEEVMDTKDKCFQNPFWTHSIGLECTDLK